MHMIIKHEMIFLKFQNYMILQSYLKFKTRRIEKLTFRVRPKLKKWERSKNNFEILFRSLMTDPFTKIY